MGVNALEQQRDAEAAVKEAKMADEAVMQLLLRIDAVQVGDVKDDVKDLIRVERRRLVMAVQHLQDRLEKLAVERKKQQQVATSPAGTDFFS